MQDSRTTVKKLPTLVVILVVAFAVYGLDQVTKILVLQNIPLQGSWSFFPTFARIFQVTFIKNTGAAFGMFPQLGSVFMVVAVVVIVSIILFHHYLPTEKGWIRLSLGLQLGGAMGNLTDRIWHGFVVDFIDIGFWPVFNLADLSIVVGVAILAYHLWDEEDPSERTEKISHLPEGGKI